MAVTWPWHKNGWFVIEFFCCSEILTQTTALYFVLNLSNYNVILKRKKTPNNPQFQPNGLNCKDCDNNQWVSKMMKSINILQLHEDQGGGQQSQAMVPSKSTITNEDGTRRASLVAYSSTSAASIKSGGHDGGREGEGNSASATSKSNSLAEASRDEDSDVRTLLAQKEKDLILAAELGKALLEKNEDLSQQNEKMADEFSKQLEVRSKNLFISRSWLL